MRLSWLFSGLIVAALSISFISVDMSAQRGERRRERAAEAKVNSPKGLNADRAARGQEPDWWVKAAKPTLDVKEFDLDNGMKVLILDHGVLPMVATYVWYKVGSMDEPSGATGVAHYLEHMMFKGSKRFNKGDVDAITAAGGGSNNAFTSTDYTGYYFNFPKANWTQALDIELDRMTTLALTQKEFDAEKKVVQEEIYRAKDDPNDRLWDAVERNAYGTNHPYAHPVLGFEKDVANMEPQDMRSFYERFYTPDNATLVIVGRVDVEDALKEVKARFGAVPRGRGAGKRKSLEANPRTPATAKTEVTLFADVATATGLIILPTESTASIRNPVRDVLADILTSGENSRLYKRLVEELGLVAGIGAFNYERRLAGSFYLSVSMLPGASDQDRARVVEVVEEEIKKLAAEGPSVDEVRKAVISAEVSSKFALESVDGLSNSLGNYQTQYGDWRFMDHYIETLKQITPKDVQHVCSLWDFDKELVVGWTLPTEREIEAPRPIEKAPEMPVFDVKEVTLENGLRLLLLPAKTGPEVVSMSAVFEAGTRTQPADKNGLAALVGQMAAAGTEKHSRAEIAKIFEDIGGTYSANARGMSAKVLSKDALTALDAIADMLQNANFPEDQLVIERRNLLASIAQNSDSHDALASRAAARLLYGAEHPYGTGASTNAELVAAYSRADLLEHFKRFVAPNNTRIIVSGRFDADAFAAKAQELFKGWERSKGAEFRRTAKVSEPERNGVQRIDFKDFDESKIAAATRVLLIDHPEKAQCICRLQRIGFTRDYKDYAAAKVMDAIFGTSAGFSDRVSKTLRDEMGLAYTTYANLSNSASEEPGTFLGYIGTRAASVPQAMVGFRALINEMASSKVTERELREAKSYLLSGLVFGLEGNDSLVSTIEDLDRYGLGWDYYQNYAKALEAVTIDDVERVAKAYLDSSKMVLVVAGPIDRIPNAESFFEAFATDAKMALDDNNNVKFDKK